MKKIVEEGMNYLSHPSCVL